MPTTWGYHIVSDGGVKQAATIECPTCNAHVTFAAQRTAEQAGNEISTDGRTVSEIFRFVSGRGRYTTSCRECERTARKRAQVALQGESRRFGVEIECNLPPGEGYSDLFHALSEAGVPVESDDDYDNQGGSPVWQIRGDGSLGDYGVEIVSPPLKGEDGHAQLKLVCSTLLAFGCSVDTRCGLHVHHDIRGARTTVDAVKRFVRTWHANQDLIDGLVSQSRRDERSHYCARWSESELRTLDTLSSLEDELGRRSR